MRSLRIALASLAIALTTSSARADLFFDFRENGTGDLSVTTLDFRSVTSSTYKIKATGTAGLYVKTSGGNESGLGLNNDPSHDHEITVGNSIDLNVAALKAQYNITKLTLTLSSVQSGENYQIYGGSIATANLLFSGVSSGGSVSVTGVNLSNFNDYIITTTKGNILLKSATVTGSAVPQTAVPEPSSLALMGIAGAIGLVVRRVRKGRVA
jgi:hypothetical protein